MLPKMRHFINLKITNKNQLNLFSMRKNILEEATQTHTLLI